jgi:hypothetical protein
VLEKTIEAYLVREVEKLGGIAFKFTSPQRRSVPDRMCVYSYGQIDFVEVKNGAASLTTGQEREKKRLQDLGFRYYVVRSKMEVDTYIRRRDKGDDDL